MATQILAINEITVLSAENEIMVRGTAYKDTLNYETTVSINFSQLNIIINCLQKANEEIDVTNMFLSSSDGNGNTMFSFNGKRLNHNLVNFDSFDINSELLRIRA